MGLALSVGRAKTMGLVPIMRSAPPKGAVNADVISGGLKRGRNTISYTIRDREGLKRPGMGIGIFVMPETPGNTPVCVFDHFLDASDTANGGSFTFTIENAHIASMNPKFKGEKPAPYHAVPLKAKPKK